MKKKVQTEAQDELITPEFAEILGETPKQPLTPQEEEKQKRRLLKKQQKAEKKETKRKEKEAKRNRFVLYDPVKMKGFTLSLPIGYFLRFFSIGFSLFGVLWLFCDAFALEQVQAVPLLLYCVAMVSAFSMIFIGRWFTLAGIGVIGAWVGLFFLRWGNILTFYVSGVETVFNAMMFRLTDVGFASLGSIRLPSFGGLYGSTSLTTLLTYGGVFALATFLALIFAAFSAKRTRLFPMILFGGGLCAICFTYNLCQTNWGIACVLAGLCSAAVLSAYDKTYKAHKHSRKSRAYSGYSAALAGLLALLIAALPAATLTTQWKEIGFISTPIKEARSYLTTILTGGNPEYNIMNTLHERRSNELEEITFQNVALFDVTAPTNHIVYLRSWVGSEYDATTDEWIALSSNEYSNMLRQMTTESANFTGDQVTFDLYSLFVPELADGTFLESGHLQNTRFGYSAAFVDIEYINNSGQLYVMPSSYASELGLFKLGSHTEAYDESYNIQADGMWTSGWFNLKKSYTAAAVMPSYSAFDYALQAEREIRFYEMLSAYVTELQRSNLIDPNVALPEFRARLDQEGLTEFSTAALEEYLSLSNAQRPAWFSRYVRRVSEYSEYVKSVYLQYPTESAGIAYVLEQIAPKLAEATTTHDKIMTVMSYLAENYRYTYTPTQPENPNGSALDAFLTETKDGYCVQFASAATLVLRAMGIPARYVQGYVASNFRATTNDEGELEYTGVVMDDDAHAWVEVYIDGLGWRTYEPTARYYDYVYYVDTDFTDPSETTTTPQITTKEPEETLPDVTTPRVTVTTAPDETTVEDDQTSTGGEVDMAEILRIVIGLAVIALIVLLLLWQYKRARKIIDGRTHFIERSIYGTFEEKADFDKVAGVLCDSIMEVHAILGNRPLIGELPGEFAARIDALPKDPTRRQEAQHSRMSFLPSTFSEIMVLIQKQEFGKALTRSELEVLGTYLSALIDSEYRHLNLFKRIWYRYIRFMI